MHHVILVPQCTATQIFPELVWGGGGMSTKHCMMRKSEMYVKSSGDLNAPILTHGPQICPHSWRNTGRQAPQWTR